MKKIAIIFLTLVLAVPPVTLAKSAKNTRAVKKPKLSRDMVFADGVVHGKYQYSNEATAVVEDDKMLNAIIGVPTNFKERLREDIGNE